MNPRTLHVITQARDEAAATMDRLAERRDRLRDELTEVQRKYEEATYQRHALDETLRVAQQ